MQTIQLAKIMADIKTNIDSFLSTADRMKWMYKEFDTPETLTSAKIKTNTITTATKKIKTDTYYDLDEVIVTLVSKDPIERCMHIQSIIDSMKSKEGEIIKKVLVDSIVMTKPKTDTKDLIFTELKDTGYTAIITFNLLNRVEKVAIKDSK